MQADAFGFARACACAAAPAAFSTPPGPSLLANAVPLYDEACHPYETAPAEEAAQSLLCAFCSDCDSNSAGSSSSRRSAVWRTRCCRPAGMRVETRNAAGYTGRDIPRPGCANRTAFRLWDLGAAWRAPQHDPVSATLPATKPALTVCAVVLCRYYAALTG